jgi:hypothetical protein
VAYRGAVAFAASASVVLFHGAQARKQGPPHQTGQETNRAIKVLVEDMQIGYIERGQAAWISPLLDEGATAEPEFDRLETHGKNVHPVLTIHVTT